MKMIALVAVATAALTTLGASAVEQSDRPSGVAETNWIHISERLGFVVNEKSTAPRSGGNSSRQILIAPPDAVSAELMPPMKGYFVIKTSAGWRRVVMAE